MAFVSNMINYLQCIINSYNAYIKYIKKIENIKFCKYKFMGCNPVILRNFKSGFENF